MHNSSSDTLVPTTNVLPRSIGTNARWRVSFVGVGLRYARLVLESYSFGGGRRVYTSYRRHNRARRMSCEQGKVARFKKLLQGDGAMKNTILTGLAELIGTAILVLLGCMGCVSGLGVVPPHFQITLTFGFAVMIVIQCIGHISEAHINPAITVGAVVLGRKSLPEALIYIVSQSAGAILGYGLIKVVTPRDHLTATGPDDAGMFCVTDLHPGVTAIQGLLLEGVSTAILMLVACALWDKRNATNTDSVPIKFGLTVAALATVIGPYTGCSMNPARSLAPALWNNQWVHHWIYWFGPIGGSLLASFMYRTVFGIKADADEETIPETVALNSVDTQKPESL